MIRKLATSPLLDLLNFFLLICSFTIYGGTHTNIKTAKLVDRRQLNKKKFDRVEL